MKIPFVFKKCGKCGRWLVANTVNFCKDKKYKYGLRPECKECYNTRRKKYYAENKEYYKKYREEHKEERRKYDKKYYKKYYEKNKEELTEYKKKWYEEHKEEILKQREKYYKENKEKIVEYHKKYYKTPQGQVVQFNYNNKRRQREEQQGEGINGDQWLEMMKYFDWKCAYSGEYIGGNSDNRTIDHIIPLVKDGAHEIWNCVPMDRGLNSRKNDKDMEEWYPQQDFYSEDRLNKINEWREYAYNKWSNDEIQKTI